MAYTKTNWQDLPNQTTPISASNLNKIENELESLDDGQAELQEQINDKNAITVNLSQDQTITTTSVTQLQINTLRTQVGSKLTLQNSSIVIGAGVNHVLVSAQMMVKAHTTDDLRRLLIYKNSNFYVRAMSRILYNYQTIGIANVLMSVSQGDTISLYSENSGASTTIAGGYADTYLTVEVVD